MRCKKHFSDHSSSVGVCASCLRDRLFSLLESQSQSQSLTHPTPDPNPNSKPNPDPNPNHPPSLIFPRSVSPYISRRKSDPIQRFYTTPQHPEPKPESISGPKKHKFGPMFKLFRSRSGKSDPNPDPTTSTSTSTSSSYIYSNYNINNRGLSPDREFEETTPDLFELPSPALRGFHRRPSPGRFRPSPARYNVAAGFAFCLSPLLRASPARNSAEAGYSGEIRVSAAGNHCNNGGKNKAHLSAAASFCKNRSRKLADIGRLNRNR